jgi:hypothetical protein
VWVMRTGDMHYKSLYFSLGPQGAPGHINTKILIDQPSSSISSSI